MCICMYVYIYMCVCVCVCVCMCVWVGLWNMDTIFTSLPLPVVTRVQGSHPKTAQHNITAIYIYMVTFHGSPLTCGHYGSEISFEGSTEQNMTKDKNIPSINTMKYFTTKKNPKAEPGIELEPLGQQATTLTEPSGQLLTTLFRLFHIIRRLSAQLKSNLKTL